MPFPSFSRFKGKRIAVITHAGADVDALAAALVLKKALDKAGAFPETVVPDHANMSAKALAKKTRNSFSINKKLQGFDALILVDFNSFEMAGRLETEIKKFSGEIFAIDHHSESDAAIASAEKSLLDIKAVSSTELVLGLLKKNKAKLDSETGSLIAAGIITDSNFFHVADSSTFEFMAEAMKASGKQFSEIVRMFRVEKKAGEKIARIKAVKRARIFSVGEHVIVTSKVGAFEADAANALIRIGADIAFVGDSDKGKIIVSGRADNYIVSKKNVDLAKDVFSKLEKFFNGSGGGHAGAAAFNGKGNIDECLEKCLELVSGKLGGKPKEY